jgi:UDP-N-acetylmuramate--alanine ligase
MPRTRRRVEADWTAIDLRALARGGPVHFVGIAGAGMAALAELVLRSGGQVSGSDLSPGAVGDSLRQRGAVVWEGHDAAYGAAAVAVVATSAAPADHPEIEAARARGVPILKRAQALGALVNSGTVLGIAGTHGKTTTTAMATAILAEAGLEPTGFIGGRVGEWGTGLRAGADRIFVVEADEYDRSFLTLQPTVAVVTSVEADHLDIYGTVDAVERAFVEFVNGVPDDGLVAGCIDDAGAARLLTGVTGAEVLRYGTSLDAALRAYDLTPHATGTRFGVALHGEPLGMIELATPGAHNVRNALGALAAALHVDAGFDAAVRALAEFRGVARRFQAIGSTGDIVFIDDYAHHPTELEATIATARASFPGRRVVALFQPHLYTRTRDFAREFGVALAAADVIWVTDVFPARERPIEGVTGELVAAAARTAGAQDVHYLPELDDAADRIGQALRAGDVCVAMGAGNIDRVARTLYAALGGAGV